MKSGTGTGTGTGTKRKAGRTRGGLSPRSRPVEKVVGEVARQEALPRLEAVVGLHVLDLKAVRFEKIPPLVHRGETFQDLVVVGAVAGAHHAPEVARVVAVGEQDPDPAIEPRDARQL